MQVGSKLCTVMRPLLSTDDLSIYPTFCTWEVCYVRRSPLSDPKIVAISWKPIHLLKRENERRTNPQTEGFAWLSFKLATFRFHVSFCTSHDDHFKIPSLKTRFLSWPTWNIEKIQTHLGILPFSRRLGTRRLEPKLDPWNILEGENHQEKTYLPPIVNGATQKIVLSGINWVIFHK